MSFDKSIIIIIFNVLWVGAVAWLGRAGDLTSRAPKRILTKLLLASGLLG